MLAAAVERPASFRLFQTHQKIDRAWRVGESDLDLFKQIIQGLEKVEKPTGAQSKLLETLKDAVAPVHLPGMHAEPPVNEFWGWGPY